MLKTVTALAVVVAAIAAVVWAKTASSDKIGPRSYTCALPGSMMDYIPDEAGTTQLKLMESAPGEATNSWSVIYPNDQPIAAESFRTQSGSLGGSRGLQWRRRSGEHVIAFLDFSDIIGPEGPYVHETIWVRLTEAPTRQEFGYELVPNPDPGDSSYDRYTCGPERM
jgi:hypothetical protein